jgi:hypothetical protein
MTIIIPSTLAHQKHVLSVTNPDGIEMLADQGLVLGWWGCLPAMAR